MDRIPVTKGAQNPVKQFGIRAVRCLLVLAMLLPLLAAGYVRSASAEVAGTVYTSPHFGYSVTWQSPWYVTEDDTDSNGFDVLGLADDQSFVYFSGGQSSASSPGEVIADYADLITSSSDWSNVQPLPAEQCPITLTEPNTAASCYSGVQLFSDGSQSTVGVFLKAWDLGGGLDLLQEAYVEQDNFAAYLPRWQQDFGVYAKGQAVPTSTAGGCDTTVEHGVNFCFDSNLPERDRSDITEAVRLGQDVIAQYFDNPDLSGVRINGFSSVSSDGDESLATTLGRSIAVYAGSDVWQGIPPIERIQTLVHEFFHVYQNVMTENSDAIVPLWFTEGTAEAVGFQAVSQLGVTDQAGFYAMAAYSLTNFPVPETLADLAASDSLTADSYPLAYIAVQYLLGSKGMSVSALGNVYTELENGATFAQAFQTVFGESLDQFYTEFEAWRPSFQQVERLPQDFWPNDGSGQPAAVAIQAVPQTAARDEQIVVSAATGSLTSCTATLQLGTGSLQRQNYANGTGALFWLITIPSDAPTGPATLTVDCGAAPATAEITIT